MDSLTVTREQFRLAKKDELEFLAQALGNISGSYTTETISPTAVTLQGTPTLAASAEPAADADSLRIANIGWVKKYAGNATDQEPGSPIDGQIWIDISQDPPTLNIWDETNNQWITIEAGGGTITKYTLANDDANLVGADATTAINAALVAAGDIADADDLSVSDQLEVTDSGNADANDNVPIGRYLYDGSTWFTRQDIYLQITGGNMTGAVTQTQRAVSSGSFDLAEGNFWTCDAIDIPQPTNQVAGQSGAIIFSAAPTSWHEDFKFAESTEPELTTFPALVPYYVNAANQILVGPPSQNFGR